MIQVRLQILNQLVVYGFFVFKFFRGFFQTVFTLIGNSRRKEGTVALTCCTKVLVSFAERGFLAANRPKTESWFGIYLVGH